MKKFLSLVLSLVMTMSLVTIGAGATEYSDFTDKGEVQYEEAVAVLNKLGIITGYEDGSFKPTGALTRGAAAKIIVSLMIGPEAAAALSVTAAPYSDVPVTNTFAGVISYCKTAGYINGYSDGTFRPTGALTGFAFSKMLLGALGYRGDVEGFTGSGWIMNVSALGSKAGLFNDFATTFKGNDGVSREAACLLALNTLKATEVEYTANGNNLVVGDKGTITGATTNYIRSYVTSNNQNINKNIVVGDVQSATGNYFTLEFGEEHFPDLKRVQSTVSDDFGRPANQWNYKNVKIGTYAWTADYSYTTSPSGDTKADEVRDMGIKDFTVPTYYYLNGLKTNFTDTTDDGNQARLEQLADELTGNGVLVELFMDENNANTVLEIVIVKTQIMQIGTVSSSTVTLKRLDADDSKQNGTAIAPAFVSVSDIKSDDDTFKTVKDLKTDDLVLVVPVTTNNGDSYSADSVVVPQSVTGKMTSIATKSGDSKVKAITVAGTSYSMSNRWTSEGGDLTAGAKLSASSDTTVYLDTYGYAIYVKDIVASNSTIIVDQVYSSLVDGKIIKMLKGWNSNGEEITINVGSDATLQYKVGGPVGADNTLQGKVFEYEAASTNDADYVLVKAGTTVTTGTGDGMVFAPAVKQWIKNGQYQADVVPGVTTTGGTSSYVDISAIGTTLPMDSGVKFIFLSRNGSDVTGITVRNGVTSVGDDNGLTSGSYDNANNASATTSELDTTYSISYILNGAKTKVIAVVVDGDDDAAVTQNLIYVKETNEHWIDSSDSNRTKAMFKAYDMEGKLLDDGHSKYAKETISASASKFYTYSKTDDVYNLTPYNKTGKTTSVATLSGVTSFSNNFISGLNAVNAMVKDLDTGDGVSVSSVSDMKLAIDEGKAVSFDLAYVYNGNSNDSGYNTISAIFVLKTNKAAVAPVVTDNTIVTSAAGAYTVSYTGATAPTADEALAAVVAKILDEGYTIDNTAYATATYTFTVSKTISGTKVSMPDLTFPTANVQQVFAIPATATVAYTVTANTGAVVSVESVSCAGAPAGYATVGGTITLGLKLSGLSAATTAAIKMTSVAVTSTGGTTVAALSPAAAADVFASSSDNNDTASVTFNVSDLSADVTAITLTVTE